MNPDIAKILRTVPLFEDLPEPDLLSLIPLFVVRQYTRGTVIFWQGDPADELFIVKSGLVKFYRPIEEKEIILELCAEGEYFGDIGLFMKNLRRSANAEAIEATTVYVLSRDALFEFLGKHPAVTLQLLTHMAERYCRAGEMIESLTTLSVRRRLYKQMLQLAEQYGAQGQERVAIGIRLTHLQLANMIGTVRETVTKIMTELQEENIVASQGKTLILQDVSKLRSMLESAE